MRWRRWRAAGGENHRRPAERKRRRRSPGPEAPEPCTAGVRGWAGPPVLPSRRRQVLGRVARGAPRLGMRGRMAAVTGQSRSPDARQGLSVLEAALARVPYAGADTGEPIAPGAT